MDLKIWILRGSSVVASLSSFSLMALPGAKSLVAQSLVFDQSFDEVHVRTLVQNTAATKIRAHLKTPVQALSVVSEKIADKTVEKVAAESAVLVNVQPTVAQVIAAAKITTAAPAPSAHLAVNTSPAATMIPAALISTPALVTPTPKEKPAVVVAAAEPAVAPIKIPVAVPTVIKKELKISLPKTLASEKAEVLVLDELAFDEGLSQTVAGAEVFWIHPDSRLKTVVDEESGLAESPYHNTLSARFIVQAPGYLPAVGYAIEGRITPVILTREWRLGPILKSLRLSPTPDRHVILGKFLSKDLKPREGLTLDTTSQSDLKAYYSLGSFGMFHPQAKESGPQGDFLLEGLGDGLQYILPAHKETAMPAFLFDLKGVSQVFTTTLVESEKANVDTQVVDSFASERPDTAVYATISGALGMNSPDEEGVIQFADLGLRNSVDLLEFRAQGYIKTWVSAPAREHVMPEVVSLFTPDQFAQIIKPLGSSVDPEMASLVGFLRVESYKKPLEVRIYDDFGRRLKTAKVVYFDHDNALNEKLKATDKVQQRFMVFNLPEGEWHAIAVDPKSKKGVALESFRAEAGTISQIQF